jgi:hypothetical protein
MKKCNKCLEEKEFNLFDKNRNTCRKCRNKKNIDSYLSKEGNIEKRREYMRKYMSEKVKNSPEYREYNSILSKLNYKYKTNDDFRKLIEDKFYDGMTHDNFGVCWEFDHIIPVLRLLRSGVQCHDIINNIDNLRPMFINENRSRNKKVQGEYFNKSYHQKNKKN